MKYKIDIQVAIDLLTNHIKSRKTESEAGSDIKAVISIPITPSEEAEHEFSEEIKRNLEYEYE